MAVVEQGYPEAGSRDGTLTGLEVLMGRGDLLVFHAGLTRAGTAWRLAGGRAAHVVARAASIEEARQRVYAAIGTLGGRGWRCRTDIGVLPGADEGRRRATVGGGSRA